MSGIKGALVVGAAVVGVGYATTSTTSSVTTATMSSTASPTSTPTPTSSTAIPDQYTVRAARDYGVRCDGVKDDTVALQIALNGLKSYQALQLPAGSCKISKHLLMIGKSNVAIVGAGKDATILQAVNPLESSLIVYQSNYVTVGGLQVYSPNTAQNQRTSDPNSKGFFFAKSNYVTVDSVKARNVAGAGVLFNMVKSSKIVDSEVDHSHADAFHVTGGSSDVLMQGNYAHGAGDDCFASIGYGSLPNSNIRIYDNLCEDNLGIYSHGPGGSAVGIEGTNGAQIYRNKGVRTGVAGLRVASQKNWNSPGSSNLDFRDNVLINVRTNPKIDHSAILVFTTLGSIRNVTFANTTVTDPLTWANGRLLNYVPTRATISSVQFVNTTGTSSDGRVKTCFSLGGGGVSGTQLVSNTLNSRPCEPH